VIVILGMLAAGLAATVYVSPDGDDSASGSFDQPLQTLAAAQAVEPRAHKRVILLSGTYSLTEPLRLTPEDSGSTWTAGDGEFVEISGAQILDLNWTEGEGGIWTSPAKIDREFAQLYVGPDRLTLARYPNFDPAKKPYGGTAADAISPERIKTWSDPTTGRVHGLHRADWGGMHYRITGVDDKGEAILEGGHQNNRSSGLHKDQRFVENILEELDEPGEWFYDGKTLHLMPGNDVDPNEFYLEVSGPPNLIEIMGTAENPVRDITLSGLSLTRSGLTYWQTNEPLLRSDWMIHRGGAIFAEGVESISIDDLLLHDLGGNGIFFSGYAKNCSVTRSQITRVGASGVSFVGLPSAVRTPAFNYNQTHKFEDIDMTPGPKSEEYPSDCRVEDCLINDIGWMEKQVAGVQISMASEITVRSTSIYDCPRAGINISEGTWGGHLIEFCDVFDTVLETGDHGSFNSWGRDRFWHPNRSWTDEKMAEMPHFMLLDAAKPTILRNSRWRCDHGWDIDLDDGSTNYILENNLCLNGGIKLREGYKRIVRNNITVGNGFHPHVWYKNSGDIVSQNIFGSRHKPIRVGEPWGQSVDHNLYDLAAWPEGGRESTEPGSILGDPLFTDPAKGDFTPRLDSPAYGIGFKAFPMERFGVQYAPLKAAARTPVIPPYAPQGRSVDGVEAAIDWLGGRIKSMGDINEASAYGGRASTGVIIVDSPAGSLLYQTGLRGRDVLLAVDGKTFNSSAELAQAFKTMPSGTELTLLRDQATIKIKT
jgi:hypothetical protein